MAQSTQSTVPVSHSVRTMYQMSGNFTSSAITTLATTVYTIAVTRQFRPNRPIEVIFPSGLQTGLIVGNCTITGNSPASGASPAVYSVNIPIYNSTAGTLTPTAQPLIIIQE